MSSYKYIAQETLQIIKDGYYVLNGQKIDIYGKNDKANDIAEVFTTTKLEYIIKNKKELTNKFYHCEKSKIFIVDGDSFDVANSFSGDKSKPLVMNFANASVAGGGFEHGINSQEQALCRNSTLYSSISSKSASKMYEHNEKINSPIDSDYMIFSDYVWVFRDKYGKLLDSPYQVGVISIPAPNKNGRARDVEQNIIDKVMMDRINKLIYASAYKGYKNIVLGAWGCGVFGHEARVVANYFYELLVKRQLNQFFDNIAFAILNDKKKLNIFREVFGNNIFEN